MLGNQLSTEKKEYSVKKWNWKREFQIIMNIIDKKSKIYNIISFMYSQKIITLAGNCRINQHSKHDIMFDSIKY